MNSLLNLNMGVKTSALGEIYESMSIKKSGNAIIFQISAQNISHKSIKHALVKCELPKHMKFHRITNEGSGNSFYSRISNSIVWNIPLLERNATRTLNFTAHVMPGMTSGDYIDVTCRILEYQVGDYIEYEFEESSMAKIKLYKV